MKFGFYYLVFLYYGTPLKGDFIAICLVLDLNYDVLATRNHKRLWLKISVDVSTRVSLSLLMSVILVMFCPCWVVASYAWNSAPIEGIDILRSIQNIYREFHFTIDINLNALPEMTQIIIKLYLSISNLHILLTTFPTPFLTFYRRSSNPSC